MIITDLMTLIDAAGTRAAELAAVVRRLGPEQVVPVLLNELIERGELADVPVSDAVVVAFDLRCDTGAVAGAVRVTPDGAWAEAAPAPGPQVTIRQDLFDLVRGVFGPSPLRTNATRSIVWHDDTPISSHSEVPRLAPLVLRLLRGTRSQPVDLSELMLRGGSDKWGLHYYTEHYERYLRPYRDTPLVLVELGIGGFDDPALGGGSLRTWNRYFHRGVICGVDLTDKVAVSAPRILTFSGDQSDTGLIASLIGQVGRPQIVIDDGSHRSVDVIASFRALFPQLLDGGLYLIEDLQTSYWPAFGGTSRDLDSDATSMGFLKRLVDGLNHEEIGESAGRAETATDRQISAVHFHHNLAVVEKGSNEEGSLPRWHPARSE